MVFKNLAYYYQIEHAGEKLYYIVMPNNGEVVQLKKSSGKFQNSNQIRAQARTHLTFLHRSDAAGRFSENHPESRVRAAYSKF